MFINPTPDQIEPNMMLRIGRQGSDKDVWQAAISVSREGEKITVIVSPGHPAEEQRVISCGNIRMAWRASPSVNLYELCVRKQRRTIN